MGGIMRKGIFKTFVLSLIMVFVITGLLAGCKSTEKSPEESKQQSEKTVNEGTKQDNPEATENPDSSKDDVKEAENKDLQNDDQKGNNNENASNNANNVTQKKDIKVKALYLTGWTAGSEKRVNHFIDVAKNTEINSYVVDIKDDDGYVGYESNIPAVREIGAWKKKYDVDKVIKAFHDNNIHVIGRLVCFKDPVLSSKREDLAVKNVNGGLWRDNHKLTWLNPYNKESWPYIIDIAKEAVSKGFDEIQFDYVRFPNDGNRKLMDFGSSEKQKYEIINEFLSYAKKELPGVVLSADVFAIICESPEDREGIGQYLEYVGKEIDYISPMAYPSHYATGQVVNKVKFPKPDLDPYGVVYNTLLKAKDRISKVDGYNAKVRPYLQDFTATWIGKGNYQVYGHQQVREQIKAVYDAGYEEWILWDPNNTYSEEAFLKEK